jgi:chromosome partitioning protein
MKVVTIAASKGGAGKTTVSCLLAARAATEARVAMFDLNADQANLRQWWILRDEPGNPRLLDVEKISRDIDTLRKEDAYDWLFIDTPPLDLDVIDNAILKSDVVIIPVRSSIFDFSAITPIVEMCDHRRKVFGFLRSAVDSRFTKLNQRTQEALESEGNVLRSSISYQQDHIAALTVGKAGFEINKKLGSEINQLWVEIKALAQIVPPTGKFAPPPPRRVTTT